MNMDTHFNIARRAVMVMAMLAIASVAGFAQSEPDFDAILGNIDDIGNFEDQDFAAIYTIVAERPGDERSVTQAQVFRRDRTDQFVILIMQPSTERGQGYIQTEENVWFYDPNSRRFERTTIRDEIQDSDAQNADFDASNYGEDYEVANWTEGQLGSYEVYVFDLQATTDDVSYENVRLWILKEPNIVLKQEDYSVNGRLLRTTVYRNYSRVGGNLVPTEIIIQDEITEGERSLVTMTEPRAGNLNDRIFTRAFLEQAARQ